MPRRFLSDPRFRRPTPPEVYFDRRRFLSTVAFGAVTAPFVACRAGGASAESGLLTPPIHRPDVFPARRNSEYSLPQSVGDRITSRTAAASHNNFYEFLPGRGGAVWRHTGDFVVDPWTVEVTGECHRPGKFGLEELFAVEHEERLYHFRCVERWAMNVPWSGFPLRRLLELVEPKSSASFVRFITARFPDQMPGLRQAPSYPWPYHEGLRMDEALHDLTFVATGIYGEPLLKQHGAPVRIVVPWKYGYKSPKSIVRIELTRRRPRIFWEIQAHEYGFLSNVNPFIPHPRWSQERSQWLDDGEWFATPLFNGYEKEVADLYPDEPRTPQRPLRPGQIAR